MNSYVAQMLLAKIYFVSIFSHKVDTYHLGRKCAL